MRFNPKAQIDTGRVQDAGTSGGSMGLPTSRTAGGGKIGLLLLVLGIIFKFVQSRRSSAR